MDIRRTYHFTTEFQRESLYGNFVHSGNPADLGIFFHAQQDSYSHAGFGAKYGHAGVRPDPHAPDKTFTSPNNADMMAADTYDSLLGARKLLPGANFVPLGGDVVRTYVRRFNRERDPKKKQQILSQLERRVDAHRKRRQEQASDSTGSAVCSAEFSRCSDR